MAKFTRLSKNIEDRRGNTAQRHKGCIGGRMGVPIGGGMEFTPRGKPVQRAKGRINRGKTSIR